MSHFGKLRHWLTPHLSNNFRAKLLHNSGIFAVIGIVLGLNIFLRLLDNTNLHILGFTSSITIDEVVRATNEQRLGEGLKPLSYSEKLADAARRKAANMFEENYWAHNSPSGKSPWVWFNSAGYSYVYAGENLAKDFGETSRLFSAWMASPTHKDNIVNPKYTEIGIAVVPGSLQGQETVLVVQLFGTPRVGAVAPPVSSPAPVKVAEVQGATVTLPPVSPKPDPEPQALVNQFSLSKIASLVTTALFIIVLVIDLVIADSKKISRRVGNNWAHLIFINFILLAITIVNAGKIM